MYAVNLLDGLTHNCIKFVEKKNSSDFSLFALVSLLQTLSTSIGFTEELATP